ncbi:MAG: M28 family peptidase [Sphingomonadales bacterium]|nr:M28 family peptidase [Sphingomonadales bacterium]
MNGFLRATRRATKALLLAALVALPAAAAAPRDREADAVAAQLRADMAVLAGDDFQGRMPGTEGESKTLRWLGRQWFDAGLVSGTNDPGHAWFAPVTLIAREPAGSTVQFQRARRTIVLAPGEALALTSARRSLIEGAPLLFVGRGAGAPPARAELAGRVAVLLDGRGAKVATAGGMAVQGSERQNALLAAGASAVLTVLDGSRGIDSVAARRKRQGYALASEALGGDLEAFVTAPAMDRLLGGTIRDSGRLAALEAEADRPDFVPRPLDLTASIEATTRETRILTHNLIGKLPGRRPDGGAVLLMAHWDHFGTCAQPPAEHLICNGAIDNASGVAALTAIARRLAKAQGMGTGLDRDVYFLATTGEELGLLGAEAFAESPPLPLKKIVAAFNLDTVAIAPAGTALGLVGRGMTPLDGAIAQVAQAEKRKLSTSTEPNTYIRRQDGWALMRHDVPAVMVTSAYGEVARLERFFDTDYHRPGDVMKPGIELGGAAQDVLFHVALVRWFADVRRWPATR